MVDAESDVSSRVMELLKIFLAASSRGEQAVLVLETKGRTLTTKFRNVESVVGTPAIANTCDTIRKKKFNPARVRRNQLRLEKFLKKKLEDSQGDSKPQTGRVELGNTSTTTSQGNMLILELDKMENTRPEKTGPGSPILQVDGDQGNGGGDVHTAYSFKSEYGEEDILYFLETIFPENEAILVYRKRIKPMKADHKCIVEIRKRDFSWPKLKKCDEDLFRELQKI